MMTDPRAIAAPTCGKTGFRQPRERVEDGVAVDVQIARQMPGGGQARARAELARVDQVAKLVGKLNVDWRSAAGTELDAAADFGHPGTRQSGFPPATVNAIGLDCQAEV